MEDTNNAQNNGNSMTASGSNLENFVFKGTGVEYFKIWIVNLLLSIVTLGLYSPWAKIRSFRYFYGNTYLAESNFEYHAEPLKILKGRIAAVIFLVCYSFGGIIHPSLGLVFGLLFIVLLPWVIVNGLRFNARMSSYRAIRFDFAGTYGKAAKYFLLMPILIVFTLGLIFPYILWKQSGYYLGNHKYGQSDFVFRGEPMNYYEAFGICLLLALSGYFLVYLLGSGVDIQALFAGDPENPPHPSAVFGLILAFYAPLLIPFIVYRGLAYRIAMNNLSINSNEFSTTMSAAQWTWIVVSNMVLIICTLGLYYPWARVRAAKYKADVTTVNVTDLDSFVGAEQIQQSALGEEIGQAFDVGVGI